MPSQRYLQSQNENILWNILGSNFTNLQNHNMTYNISGGNFITKINGIEQLTVEEQAVYFPSGVSAEKINITPQEGMIRFDTNNLLIEYYNGTDWLYISSPPDILSINPTTVTQPNYDISINGNNFENPVNVSFIGNDGTIYTSPQVTYFSSILISAQTPSIALTISNEPYSIKVTNSSSGLSSILPDVLDAGDFVQFSTPAGSLGTIYDSFRTDGSYSLLDISASDPDGDVITYDICGGSLPTGLSLNSTTGVISGTASQVVNTTTYSFTVGAVTFNATTTRQFSITINQPVTLTYSFNASSYEQYFSIPPGLPAITIKMWGAGGGQYYAANYGNVGGVGGGGGFSQSTITFLPVAAIRPTCFRAIITLL